MPPRLNLSQFKGDSDSEGDDIPSAPKNQPVLSNLKQQTFSHGTYKKSRLEIEKEKQEQKRIEEEKAAAKVFKEFSEAFEGDGVENTPRGGTVGGRGGRGGGGGGGGAVRGGFVKASGDASAPGTAYTPSRPPPSGPSSSTFVPPTSTTFQAAPSPPTGPRSRHPPTSSSSTPYSNSNAYGSSQRSYPPQQNQQQRQEMDDGSAGGKPKAKGKRAMDSFLEEIKREQNERERKFGEAARQDGTSVSALAAWERNRGSHDLGDKESNLPSGINEESLGLFFAKYGPIGAVKIMWPRGDEDASVGAFITSSRRAKAGLSGFVAYMRRKDAEVAVKELDGLDWGGTIIRVGWSKMVKIPLRPIIDLSGGQGRAKSRSRSPKRHRRERSDSRSRSPDRRRRSRSDSRSPGPSRRARERSRSRSPPARARAEVRSRGRASSESSGGRSRSASRSPSPARKGKKTTQEVYLEKLLARIGGEKEKFVRAVAGRVTQHGIKFEEMLREREAKNEKFSFLRDVDLPEYHLYRHCTDSRYRLPSPPPDAFGDDGKADLYSSDSAEDSERERSRKGALGKMARKRFESGLRAITGERGEIARLMEFSMNHADAADEVCDVICQSLVVESTPVPRKMARFHLISDILHNAASPLPNVWRYRQAFETRLPSVFEHLADVHRSLVAYAGRLSAETFKQQVSFVLDIWENWIVFTPAVTEQMRSILNGAAAQNEEAPQATTDIATTAEPTGPAALPSKFKKTVKASGFKPVPPGPTPFVHDLDGEAMDLDGAPIEDLDGEDLDGEMMMQPTSAAPYDDDLDGEMMAV